MLFSSISSLDKSQVLSAVILIFMKDSLPNLKHTAIFTQPNAYTIKIK